MTVRPMTRAERKYCWTQSLEIRYETANIGYMEARTDGGGEGFASTWNGFRDDLKTELFDYEFRCVLDALRSGEGPDAFLRDGSALAEHCRSHPEAAMDNGEYGFRADTEHYAFLIRLDPDPARRGFCCFCYLRGRLDRHMRDAERGIRFVDTRYRDLFYVPDGGKIRITYADGNRKDLVCRYVTPVHAEIGGPMNVFHIYDFAESLERNLAKIEAVDLLERPGRAREAAR